MPEEISQEDIVKNLEQCSHFSNCSQNLCPLDLELYLRSGKKQDRCRYMREPKRVSIKEREFVSGGAIMDDAPLKFVPQDNVNWLNTASKIRWEKIKK